MKGCNGTTAESLQSWFNQNYAGRTQILFGVADANDPVCKIVRELIEKNPGHDAQLVFCNRLSGANAKVAKLEKSANSVTATIEAAGKRKREFR